MGMHDYRKDAKYFGIDPANLQLRRDFIRLDATDQAVLSELIPWAEKNAPAIATAFYDWQFSFGPTARFFENYADQKGVSVEAVRETLEAAQVGYLTRISRVRRRAGTWRSSRRGCTWASSTTRSTSR
jgi:hypothetical protein